jgi:hypothetical protein
MHFEALNTSQSTRIEVITSHKCLITELCTYRSVMLTTDDLGDKDEE